MLMRVIINSRIEFTILIDLRFLQIHRITHYLKISNHSTNLIAFAYRQAICLVIVGSHYFLL
jgi:hypothetical protein